MKNTGLYLNLLTNTITEYEIKSSTYSNMIHNAKTKKLIYLGKTDLLPCKSLLEDAISTYYSIFTKEELPMWLESSSYYYDKSNEVVACCDNDGHIVKTKEVDEIVKDFINIFNYKTITL